MPAIIQTEPTRKQQQAVSPTFVTTANRRQSKSPVTMAKVPAKSPTPVASQHLPSKSQIPQSMSPQQVSTTSPVRQIDTKVQTAYQQPSKAQPQQPITKTRPIVEATKFDSLEVQH